MKGLLEHMGIDEGRIHFSWISSAEATKFARVAQEVAGCHFSPGSKPQTGKKSRVGEGDGMNSYTEKIRERASALLKEG